MSVNGFRQSFTIYALHFVCILFYYTCVSDVLLFAYGSIRWVAEGNGLLIHPLTPNIEPFTFRINSKRLHHSNGKNAFAVWHFPVCFWLLFVHLFIAVRWRFAYWIYSLRISLSIPIFLLVGFIVVYSVQWNISEILKEQNNKQNLQLHMNHPFAVIACLRFIISLDLHKRLINNLTNQPEIKSHICVMRCRIEPFTSGFWVKKHSPYILIIRFDRHHPFTKSTTWFIINSYALYTSIKCVWFWFSLVRVRNVFCYSMKNHSEPCTIDDKTKLLMHVKCDQLFIVHTLTHRERETLELELFKHTLV